MELNKSKNRTNPILISQTISKLLTTIKKDPSGAVEIKFLKEKCITAKDAGIGLAASKGLILLAECGILQTTSTLSELVSSLSLAGSFAGITAAICDLLFLELKLKINDKEENFKCVYNLRAPQHPLISLFIRSHDTCYDILSKIKYFYLTNANDITIHANELLFPFYMYILCNPTTDVPEHFYHELWNFIVPIQESESYNVIVCAIIWLQMSTEKQTLRASKVLIESINIGLDTTNNKIIDAMVLWLTSVACELIELELDPREIILYLCDNIESLENVKAISSCMLTMLAECVPLCPPNYLDDLLRLCFRILQLGFSNNFSIHFLKASVLQWMVYGCLLSSHSLNIANQILFYINNSDGSLCRYTSDLLSNKTFCHVKNTNQQIHAAVELNIFSECLPLSNILEWLNRLDKVPVHILKKFFNYYVALLLYKNLDPDIVINIIHILLKISNHFKETTTHLLTLFLYKLSNDTNSRIHFALLKALPKMAVLKENLPLVLNTLELFRKGMFGLKSFVLTLFYDLWNANEKCYLYLYNVLVAPDGGRLSDFYITKAYVIKEICVKRPEVYGRELVSHLSEILNKCHMENEGAATAFAIDAIRGLCKVGIVDINSAWNELSPQFKSEKRVIVFKSLCSFMAETAYFESSECSELTLDDILKTLWHYGSCSENSEIISAAYKALTCFTLEQISVHFPDKFRVVSPLSNNSLSFNLIPGRYWINMLLNVQEYALSAVSDLLIQLVSVEISSYRSGTYNVSEQHEPQNYNYLPEQSIIRALENYTRTQVTNWHKSPTKAVYLQCLRVLSQEYSKPLPPVDWCFLQELVHFSESRSYCITIASHQVQLSGTARRLVENFITSLSNMSLSVEDVETIYRNLKFLCNSIQPMTLRPFVKSSVKFALEKAQNEKYFKVLDTIVLHICNTLKDENLQEVNRLMLSQVIVSTLRKLDYINPLFIKLSDCITVLPIRYIDELSSPRLWKEPSDQQMKKSIQIRCMLALKATVSPLTWLNDIMDIEHLGPLYYSFFTKNLIEVMKTHRDFDFASSWIMELLGNIQSTIANKFMTQQHLKFLCDVFILSVIVLSGHDLYLTRADELLDEIELRLRFLPQSIAQLIKLQQWKSYASQIAEWLYHMVSNALTPEDYKIAFYESLASLKHEDFFQKTSKWMTYVGITLPLNIC